MSNNKPQKHILTNNHISIAMPSFAELLRSGIYATTAVTEVDLQSLLNRFYPIQIDLPLIRLGGKNDGGYLLPDDFINIKSCFSPGTGDSTQFEEDLYDSKQIPSHLSDPTVPLPTEMGYIASTQSLFVGPFSTDTTVSFEDWFDKVESREFDCEYIAQIDIEGGEYLSLMTIPTEILKKFRILIVEFHELYNWTNPIQFKIVNSLIERLLCFFDVVHLHPNNNDETIQLHVGDCPRTIEVTFHKKNRHKVVGCNPVLPHLLDSPNNPSKPDIELLSYWSRWETGQKSGI